MKTKFELHQKVQIKTLENTVGLILVISLDALGLWYKVRYFCNGKAEEVFFLENELEAA